MLFFKYKRTECFFVFGNFALYAQPVNNWVVWFDRMWVLLDGHLVAIVAVFLVSKQFVRSQYFDWRNHGNFGSGYLSLYHRFYRLHFDHFHDIHLIQWMVLRLSLIFSHLYLRRCRSHRLWRLVVMLAVWILAIVFAVDFVVGFAVVLFPLRSIHRSLVRLSVRQSRYAMVSRQQRKKQKKIMMKKNIKINLNSITT